jgi:hypothetical protein
LSQEIMAEQLPIVLCGKTTVIGEKVIELLKPEYEGMQSSYRNNHRFAMA